MIYITGDTYGQFKWAEAFCEHFQTKREDILIILGDVGINFSGGMRIGGNGFWRSFRLYFPAFMGAINRASER